ncbi:MAG: TolC family protein [Magnetococcales bacterium]|nr:TolC family protein [Magnetococcales bacterium]
MINFLKSKLFVLACMLVFGCATPVSAGECRIMAEQMLERHPRLDALKREVQVAKANIGRTQGGWFPDLKLNGAFGEEYRKPANGGTVTNMNAHTLTMTVNQLLWDFGKINAEIAKANLALLQAELGLNNQRGELLLDAATTCINVLRGYRALALAEQSVANIRKQTGLEESRVELGGGLQTDALQARSQLSGAQARHARAKGALNIALNHFRMLFAGESGRADTLYELQNPTSRLPETQDKVLEEVLNNNIQLQISKVMVTSSQMEKQRVIGADLSPRVGAVVEKKYKSDAEGIRGNQQEHASRMEISYPFNVGLAGFHALDGAREGIAAADSRLLDTRQQVEEQANNGWESIITAQENADFLENQARIAAEFLRMAKEERMHGARSLIDVLSGETGLINAQSDALAAQADVAIAQFGLLKTMGLLHLEALNSGPRFVLPTVSVEVNNKESPTLLSTLPPVEKSEEILLVASKSSPLNPEPEVRQPLPKPTWSPEQSRKVDEPENQGEIKPGDTVTLIQDTRLRSKPSMRSRVIKMLPEGTTVTVMATTPYGGDWLQLENNAWIAAQMVAK